MTDRSSGRTEVHDHLSRICGIAALSLLVLIIALVILERAGTAKEAAGYVLVLGVLALYAGAGVLSRTADQFEYQVAGCRIPAAFAGMAAGAEWTSAAIVLGAAGSLFLGGYDGRSLLIGVTGGYLLLAVLIGPYLRNLGVRTVPDFMAARYGGVARFLAMIVLVACSSIFAAALIQGAVPAAASVLGSYEEVALFIVVAVILLCALPGGMFGVTATQVAQFVVLVVGCLALFLIFEAQRFDAPGAPTYDPVIEALEAIVRGLGLAPTLSPRSVSFHLPDTINNLELVVCLVMGTASLPHLTTRFLTVPGTGEARASSAWSLLFVAILVFALPTYVTLSNAEGSREQGGVIAGLVALVGLTAMLAAASGLLLTIANSLEHDVHQRMSGQETAPGRRLIIARLLLVAVAVLVAYAARTAPPEPLSMAAWAFSLAAAGFFPALVLGIWWKRTTSAAANCGIVAGFGVCLFYIVVSRYFPQAGLTHFGMSALLDPANGEPLVNVAQVLADPKWLADVPARAGNPLASKVVWLNVSNLAGGLFGLSSGFAAIIVVSLLGKKASAKTQALVDALHAPVSEKIR